MNELLSYLFVYGRHLSVGEKIKSKGLLILLGYLSWFMKINYRKKKLLSPVNTSLLPRQPLGSQ